MTADQEAALLDAIREERRLLQLSREQYRDLGALAPADTWDKYQLARHRVNTLIGAHEPIPAEYAARLGGEESTNA